MIVVSVFLPSWVKALIFIWLRPPASSTSVENLPDLSAVTICWPSCAMMVMMLSGGAWPSRGMNSVSTRASFVGEVMMRDRSEDSFGEVSFGDSDPCDSC